MLKHTPSFLFVALVVSPALAQSSSRSLPSNQPTTVAQPQSRYVVPQSQIQYGSSTRPGTVIQQSIPSQGSATRSGVVIQQGSSTRGNVISNQQMSTVARTQTFEQRLWDYLLRAKYRNWAPVPGNSDTMYEGQSPHGAFLMMYLNRKAAGNAQSLPVGSIVIKENFTPQKSLAAITVMYKTKGYNPKAADWYWVKYNPDGTVAQKPTERGSMRLAGRVGGCIDCHSGADGGDFAFFND